MHRVPRFFTSHQAAVVADATARIAPGPRDDPAEAGHPGAREAGVTDYIDVLLGALNGAEPAAAVIFAGLASLDPVARIAWRGRITGWRRDYTDGIAALDRLAGGDFTTAPPADQDSILASPELSAFTSLLFEHTIEGLYADPAYAGNRGLAGWTDIGFPGDVQPRGYTADEVERSDGPDPLAETPIVTEVLNLLSAL